VTDETEDDIVNLISKHYATDIEQITNIDTFFNMIKEMRNIQDKSKEEAAF
jgi:hypothetical protein